jgi:ABC-type phosphate/phosphonate transport system substrate-binding protein
MKSNKRFILEPIFCLALAVGASSGAGAAGQTSPAKAAPPPSRILLAINEGGAANADATETLFKYQEFGEVVEKALRMQVLVVAVRDPEKLRKALKKHEYGLLLSRPADTPAEAIRDSGYQPIAMAKESSAAMFIVPKDSPLKTIADVKGRTIVTPDAYTHMWRVANAMLRDANIVMAGEKVRAMRDQAAIGWSMENKFFDVGVVNSISGIGRTWEKNGGRVIAKSREMPNMPFIAAPEITEEQVARVRAAVVALGDQAILKKMGIPSGFQAAYAEPFLSYLVWVGDLRVAQNAAQN